MERYPIPEDNLLAELDWVRAIARQLVTDAGLVDDVVQETWLVAATRPPRAQSGRGLRRWLARVTRSIAVRLLRGERARLRRERDAARPEGLLADPPDILALATQQKQLMAAVLELEEPYRAAVLMRYFEELTPDEIAERQGISSDNARQRVSRGLANVRRRLEREWTERERRQLPILGFYIPEPAAEPALARPFALKWLVAAAATVLVLGAWWRWRASDSQEHPQTLALASSAQPHTDFAPTLDTAASAAREPLATGSPAEPTRAPRAHRFHGRIVDLDGRPLPGATLELPILPHLPPARCDADGRFELVVREEIPLDPGSFVDSAAGRSADDRFGGGLMTNEAQEWTVQLFARAPGHAPLSHWIYASSADWSEDPPRVEHALGELVLVPVGTLAGRLLAPGAVPLAGHPVALVRFEAEPAQRFDASAAYAQGETDDEGRFLFADVPEGLWRVFGGGPGWRWTSSGAVRLDSADELDELELCVVPADPATLLRGRVLGLDGRPVAGARVVATPALDSRGAVANGAAGPDGEFELQVTPEVAYDLSAYGNSLEAGPFGTRHRRTLRDVRSGMEPLELALAEAPVLALRVSDTAGRPVPSYELHMEGEGVLAARAVRLGDDAGRGFFDLPDHPCRLILRAEGYAALELGLLAGDGASHERSVQLVPLARLRGVVLAAGRPLTDAAVEIARVLGPDELQLVDGFPARIDRRIFRRVRVDAQGEFELPILARGSFVVRAEAGDWAAAELGPLALDPEHDERVELELTQGGTVVGRVQVAPGDAPADHLVRLTRADGHVLSGATDTTGRYSIDHLSPGSYLVSARRNRHVGTRVSPTGPEDLEGTPAELPWALEVREGTTTVHDIDLGTPELASLSGTLLVDGRPHGLASLRHVPGARPWSERSALSVEQALARDGSFALADLATGPGWVVLGLAGGALDGLCVVRRVELARGANRTRFELTSAGLSCARPADALAFLARLDESTFTLTSLTGRGPLLVRDGLPAAEQAWLVQPGPELDPDAWRKLVALVLRAGEWTVRD